MFVHPCYRLIRGCVGVDGTHELAELGGIVIPLLGVGLPLGDIPRFDLGNDITSNLDMLGE